jgi:hypothetical protein
MYSIGSGFTKFGYENDKLEFAQDDHTNKSTKNNLPEKGKQVQYLNIAMMKLIRTPNYSQNIQMDRASIYWPMR